MRINIRVLFLFCAALIRNLVSTLALAALIASANAANQVVSDAGDNGGPNQLRAKLTAAMSGGGTITFTTGTATIVLGGILPTITTNITIDGGNVVTISGANAYSIFSVNSGATLILNNLTISNGYNTGGDGGAIQNRGTLNINNSKFFQNRTAPSWSGGAILSVGPLTISNTEFAGNQAGNGGALYPRFSGAVTAINGCNFHDNSTTNTTNGWGGAMLIWDGAQVGMQNCQFTNNMAKSGSFSSSTIDRGGAIYVTFNSVLTASNSQFSGNSAFFGGALYVDPAGRLSVTGSDLHDNSIGIFDGTQGGGAIYNAGTLIVDTDQLHDNHADGAGGAISNVPPGSMQVRNSVFRHNSAGGGAAISNTSNATVTTSTLADNTADAYGGAIDTSDETDTTKSMTVTASTLSGNSASLEGGAIVSQMKLTLTNVTITGNSGPEAVADYDRPLILTNVTIAQNTGKGLSLQLKFTLTMSNTLLASNSGGDCATTVPSSGFNLADDTTCGLTNTGDRQGPSFNPKLGLLQNNGGPTLTMLPGPGSPAIDNGTGLNAPATDQRGVMRPQGAAVDIGAVEVAPSDAPTPTPRPTATPTATPGLVANVSTRLPVGTDDNVLIEGFIVQGPGGSSKKIVVRAIGPSLIPFGVADAVANPTLEIFDGNSVKIASNNDWKITQVGGIITGDQSAEIAASGLAPGNELESAIIANLAPGSYTAVVRGLGNTVGTGVVDAYDVSAGSSAKLANIATRGLVQPGDKLMIAGFIIQNGPVRVVVTALGPSLLAFGVSNALPDTTLQLRDQNGVIVKENDNWKTDQQAELESTGLQPGNDLEAALVTTIQPGQYTAQVRGQNNASGIAVVQVYFLQ